MIRYLSWEKTITTCTLACLISFSFSYPRNSLADTLVVFNWEDYLSDEVIARWEKKSGHKIKQIYYDGNENRDSVLVAIGNDTTEIDILIADETATPSFGTIGTLLSVNAYESTPNIHLVDKKWDKVCGAYGVPYLWGTLGVAYRSDKVTSAPTSWDILFNPPPLLSGHIGWLDESIDTLAPALFLANNDINTRDPDTLRAAFEKTKRALPHILTFQYSLSYLDSSVRQISKPAEKELYLAMSYSGDQDSLNEQSGTDLWQYTTLDEGTISWVDCLAVLKNSSRKALAFDFINFLYQPENAAQNSLDAYTATPMSQAKSLQPIDFQNDSTVYPGDTLDRSQPYLPMDNATAVLRRRITSTLEKLHESK